MRICRECGIGKPDTEYYAHHSTSDGLMRNCKECHRASNRKASLDRYYAKKAQNPEYKSRGPYKKKPA